jgi:hypothetical protein
MYFHIRMHHIYTFHLFVLVSYNEWLTDWMTPRSKVILEKLTHPQVVTKFLHFMEPKGSLPRSWKCITCPILSQTILVQAPYPISLRFNLILSSHICLGLPNGSYLWRFPTKILYAHLHSPIMYHMPCPSHSSWFEHSHNICWKVQNMKLLITQYPTVSHQLIPQRPKYLPQHPVLKHPYLIFPP